MTQAEFLERWGKECGEWQAIADEFTKAGKEPSAYDVTLEQRKRALRDGRRLLTQKDFESIQTQVTP